MPGFDVLNKAASSLPCLYYLAGQERKTILLPNDFPASVICVHAEDWFRDYSPWPAPPLREKEKGFPGGGDNFLQIILEDILPRAEEKLGFAPAVRFTAGYSLAGLFALYALTKTDFFQGCACMSGSLWYPGWLDYLRRAVFPENLRYLYFSLGKKEGKTRHPVLSGLDRATEETVSFFRNAKVPCRMEWFPGGHFLQTDDRVRAGLAALAGCDSQE